MFYQHNPDAAKGKTRSTAKTKVDSAQESSSLASFPTTGWSSDRSLLPAVDAGTILSHLIRTGKGPSAAHADTQEVTIVQKPLRRGQDFFFCGYVHDVCVCRKGGHCFLKGKCFASQKKAVKYEQGIQLTEGENGASVLFAACKGCPAGADGGLCQHVFALLLAVEHYGPKKEGNMPGEQSKTSMKQSWGPRERDVEPKPVMSIVVEKSKLDRERKGPAISCTLSEHRGPHVASFDDEDLEDTRFALPEDARMLLPRCLPPDRMTTFGVTPKGCTLSYQTKVAGSCCNEPPTKRSRDNVCWPALPLVDHQEYHLDNADYQWTLPLTEAQHIEKITRLQTSSTEWKEIHSYTITSSNFLKVVRCKRASDSLLSSLFDGPDLTGVPAIVHGRNFEKTAVEVYLASKAEQGNPVKVRECGVSLHPAFRFLGASPDRVVFDASATPRYGLLEVKCPHSAFNASETVHQAAATRSEFCCTVLNGQVRLKRNHAYYYQVQGQMAITGAVWCDFFVWIGSSTHLERVFADKEFWASDVLPGLLTFYYSSAIPYLKGRGRPIPPSPQDCQQESAGAFVAQYEQRLTYSQSQSRINGRNGSSACTIIASLFTKSILAGLLDGTDDSQRERLMCTAMIEGNCLYDDHHIHGLISMDEAIALTGMGILFSKEYWVRPTRMNDMVDWLIAVVSEEPTDSDIIGGVITIHPVSFSISCSSSHLILFDSHSHGNDGALLAKVPLSEAVQYLENFFEHHYPDLSFNATAGPNVIGLLTLIKLST